MREPVDLKSALRAFVNRRSNDASDPLTQPGCLSLPSIVMGLTRGWKQAEQTHVSDCPFCQRAIAMSWKVSPPGSRILAEYIAGTSPYSTAMERYLRDEPHLRFIVETCRTLVLGLGETTAAIQGILDSMALPLTLGPSEVVAVRGAETPRVRRNWRSNDNVLHCEIFEAEDETIQLRVSNPDGGLARQLVMVEVAFKGKTVARRLLPLQANGDGTAQGQFFVKKVDLNERAPDLADFDIVLYPAVYLLLNGLCSGLSDLLEGSNPLSARLAAWRSWVSEMDAGRFRTTRVSTDPRQEETLVYLSSSSQLAELDAHANARILVILERPTDGNPPILLLRSLESPKESQTECVVAERSGEGSFTARLMPRIAGSYVLALSPEST